MARFNTIEVWEGLVCYFEQLSYSEQKAMILRAGPQIVGAFKEWGFNFDGLVDAEDLIERIKKAQ